MPDTPGLYLNNTVNLLTSTRGLGSADRIREGYKPYSTELDFHGIDEATAQAKIAWASDQAPWAQFEIVPASTVTGGLTIFLAVDVQKLALYLVERVLLQEKGQTWQTATGALPDLARNSISETVGARGAWQSLVSRLKLDDAALTNFLCTIEADSMAGPVVAVIQETISQTVGPTPGWSSLVADLQGQESVLHKIVQAIETGEYL